MKFLQETGAIISQGGQALAYYDGNKGEVTFDFETIMALHKASPGCIWKFAHTHPMGMEELSETDKTFLKTLSPILYPFPVRLSTVTFVGPDHPVENHYVAIIESKESWKKSDNKFREIRIVKENREYFYKYDLQWKDYLINRSYERN